MESEMERVRESILGLTLPKLIMLWLMGVIISLITLPFSIFFIPIALVIGMVAITLMYCVREKKLRQVEQEEAARQEKLDALRRESARSEWAIKAGRFRHMLDKICFSRFESMTAGWYIPKTSLVEIVKSGVDRFSVEMYDRGARETVNIMILNDSLFVLTGTPAKAASKEKTQAHTAMHSWAGNQLADKIQNMTDAGEKSITLTADMYPDWFEPLALAGVIVSLWDVYVNIEEDGSLIVEMKPEATEPEDGLDAVDFGFPVEVKERSAR
jgi:hypothetical protein